MSLIQFRLKKNISQLTFDHKNVLFFLCHGSCTQVVFSKIVKLIGSEQITEEFFYITFGIFACPAQTTSSGATVHRERLAPLSA